jgi:hypothetical protein
MIIEYLFCCQIRFVPQQVFVEGALRVEQPSLRSSIYYVMITLSYLGAVY